MKIISKYAWCAIAAFTACISAVSAQDSTSTQDTTLPKKKYPAVVLVQLRSEHNRLEAMARDKRYKEMEEVKRDAQIVQQKMIADFHKNFTYCPVYYYIDTNAALVKAKHFDGILLQEDGSPVKDAIINSDSGDYVIAYYGYPLSQSKRSKVQNDTSLYTYDPQSPNVKGLVILNDKFLQLTYFYKLGYWELLFPKGGRYTSKHYDIEYFPLAIGLDWRLSKHRHRKLKHKKDLK